MRDNGINLATCLPNQVIKLTTRFAYEAGLRVKDRNKLAPDIPTLMLASSPQTLDRRFALNLAKMSDVIHRNFSMIFALGLERAVL